MSTIETRIFPISKAVAPTYWVGCLFLGGLGVAWLFLFAHGLPSDLVGNLLAGGLISAPFLLLSVVCARAAWLAPTRTVAVDADGVWSTCTGKERGLVPWGTVAKLHARIYAGTVSLRDAQGKRLLDLDTSLTGFPELLKIVVSQVKESYQFPAPPVLFRITAYGYVQIIAAVCFAITGTILCTVLTNHALGISLGALLIGMSIWLLSIEVLKLTVREDRLVIRYPFRTRTLAFTDIKAMKMEVRTYHNTHIYVQLHTDVDKGPLRLETLGYGAPHLYLILARLLANTSCVVS